MALVKEHYRIHLVDGSFRSFNSMRALRRWCHGNPSSPDIERRDGETVLIKMIPAGPGYPLFRMGYSAPENLTVQCLGKTLVETLIDLEYQKVISQSQPNEKKDR